jgi:hypothetical protein
VASQVFDLSSGETLLPGSISAGLAVSSASLFPTGIGDCQISDQARSIARFATKKPAATCFSGSLDLVPPTPEATSTQKPSIWVMSSQFHDCADATCPWRGEPWGLSATDHSLIRHQSSTKVFAQHTIPSRQGPFWRTMMIIGAVDLNAVLPSPPQPPMRLSC